jgi:hypothetical protein
MVSPVLEVVHQSADDFIRHILFERQVKDTMTDLNELRIVYRGERSAKPYFKLLPNLLRENNPGYGPGTLIHKEANPNMHRGGHEFFLNEFKTLYKFYVTANKNGFSLPEIEVFKEFELDPEFDPLTKFDLWIPEALFEIAGLAQHYGVPTRLLDWTFNPFTALYFAAIGAVENFYSHVRDPECGPLSERCKHEIDDRIVIWELRIDDINVMNKEYPDMRLKWIRPPYNRNPNLTAQLGLFTHVQQKYSLQSPQLSQPDRTPLNEILRPIGSNKPLLFRHMIPIGESNHVLTHLQRLQHTASKIFTGFGGVAKEVIDQEKRDFIKHYWPM